MLLSYLLYSPARTLLRRWTTLYRFLFNTPQLIPQAVEAYNSLFQKALERQGSHGTHILTTRMGWNVGIQCIWMLLIQPSRIPDTLRFAWCRPSTTIIL